MSRFFVDTSALFKRYIMEPGSEAIDGLARSAGTLYISQAAVVELLSNFKRLEAVERVLTAPILAELIRAFWTDVETGTLTVVPITSAALRLAGEMLEARYLTPLDALQVAVAASLAGEVIFVSADARLNAAAESLGLVLMDPTQVRPSGGRCSW